MVRGDADGSLLVPGPKDQGHALLKQQVGSWSQPACQPGQGEAALAASFNLSAPARVSAGPPGPAAPPADASSEYAWIPLGRPNGTKKVDDADPISPGASVRRTHANEPAGAEIERGKDAVAALRPPALDTTAVSKGGQGSNVTSSRPLEEAWSEGDYALAEPAAFASAAPPAGPRLSRADGDGRRRPVWRAPQAQGQADEEGAAGVMSVMSGCECEE